MGKRFRWSGTRPEPDIRLKARFMSTVSHDAGDQGKSALVRTRTIMSSCSVVVSFSE